MKRSRRVIQGGRREPEKHLVTVSQDVDGHVTGNTLLYTAVQPGSISGLRWSLDGAMGPLEVSDDPAFIKWFVVLVQEGDEINGVSVNNGDDTYRPADNVMAFGTFAVIATNRELAVVLGGDRGASRSARNLSCNDRIELIVDVQHTNPDHVIAIRGTVQFFWHG